MKKIYIVAALLTIFTGIANAYTPPATYDPSGSESGEYEINCEFSREYYSMINPFSVILYDSKCGNSKPTSNYEPDVVVPEPDQEPWKPDVTPDTYEQSQYDRELKVWADKTAYTILTDLVNRYRNGEYVNYLTNDQLFDMSNYGYQFQEPMEECLSYWVANDVDNIGNMIRSNYDVAGYMAGKVRNCYVKVRTNNSY